MSLKIVCLSFYTYNAIGVKVSKFIDDELAQSQSKTEYFPGGFQYKNSQLEFFPTPEGYVNVTKGKYFNYVYNYTDHLGNMRLSYTFDKQTQSLAVLQENHYYPFGMKHTNYGVSKVEFKEDETGFFAVLDPVIRNNYQYKYNGKEYQDELNLNLYDYGARNYDPAIGRWMNIDPLAETSRRFSPYTYCLNNPVFFIDPDGMEAKSQSENTMTNDDVDVMVDIGYGRMREVNQISGSVGFSGGTAVLNEKGQEKITNSARSILTSHDIDPDQELTNVGGFNKGGEKEAKESYANKFINKVTLLRNLLSSANPIIKFSYNLPGKSAEYIENSNLLKLTYKSFENNLSLFFDLVHEGVHSFDFNKNRMFVDYILGDLTTQSRNILESRAWGVQVYFGDTRPHTINQAKKYKDNAFNNQSKKYNVEKWDIGKFFRIK